MILKEFITKNGSVFSIGQARRLADMEAITVNGEPEKNLHRELKPGDVVQIGKREQMLVPQMKKFTGEINSCPFCGGHNLKLEQVNVGPLAVSCSCGARGPLASKPPGAVNLWNHRGQPTSIKTTIHEQ